MVESLPSDDPGSSRTSFQTNEVLTDEERICVGTIMEVFSSKNMDEVIAFVRKRPALTLDNCVSIFADEEELKGENKDFGPVTSENPSTSTATDNLAVVKFISKKGKNEFLPDEVDADFQRALTLSQQDFANGLDTSYLPIDLESAIRNDGRSAGLKNLGNTCWLNSVVQLLYSLPAFRSLTYACVPDQWKTEPKTGISDDKRTMIELLLELRNLFAELRFTEISHLRTVEVLKNIDHLMQWDRKEQSIMGQQQDATEMLLHLMDWYEKAFNAAMDIWRNPDLLSNEENFVVADSTTGAPNSDVSGIAPPAYDAPGTSTTVREAQTRDNTPEKTIMSLEAIPEMRGRRISQPPPQKIARREEMAMDVDSASQPLIDDFVSIRENLFSSMEVKITEGSEASPSITRNCPQMFQLRVNFNNLHDALEEATYDHSHDNGKITRTIYDKLPSVLLMNLCRFRFDDHSTKLHDRFTFPRQVYMDRYLKCNEEKVLALREQQSQLREQLSRTTAERKGLFHYPHGDMGETKLVDAFKTVIEAMTNFREKEDAEMNLLGESFPGPLIGPLPRHVKRESATTEDITNFIEDQGKLFPRFETRTFPQLDSCVSTLMASLEMLKQKEHDLEAIEKALKEEIQNTYEQEDLQQHRYHLHGVIVHRGDMNSGHYYTFLRKKSADGSEEWEKLNDEITSVVPWETVERDSFGDDSAEKPSAYLLVYVRSNTEWLMEDDGRTLEESFNKLPADLKHRVENHRTKWNETLCRFRDHREQAAEQAQTTQVTFSWCRKSFGQTQGDKSANLRESELVDKLVNQKIVFDDDEMKEVDRISQHIWNRIMQVSPGNFESMAAMLDYHLKEFTDPNAVKYIEDYMGQSISELRSDAENDVERVFSEFVNGYVHRAITVNKRSPRTNFVFFISLFPQISAAVQRYIIVRAMSQCTEFHVLSRVAQKELEDWKAQDRIVFLRTGKVAMMLAAIYELASISVYLSFHALDHYQRVQNILMGNDKLIKQELAKVNEHSYLAMAYARSARVAVQIVRMETQFLKLGGISFVNDASMYIGTVLPMCLQVKMLIDRVIDSERQNEDIGFFLNHNERTISPQMIEMEICHAANSLLEWKLQAIEVANNRSASQDNMTLSLAELADPETVLPANILDISAVYNSFSNTIDLLSQCTRIQTNPERKSFVDQILEALTKQVKGLRDTRNEIPHMLPEVPSGKLYENMKKLRIQVNENKGAVKAVENILGQCGDKIVACMSN